MDYEKYRGTYSGLDKLALSKLFDILNSLENNIRILEFGSGQSTQFLVDYKLYSNKNIIIDSYDNDEKYCFQNSKKYHFLNLKIKPLISCSDETFNKQLNEKKYNREYFTPHKLLPYNHPNFWRQRNCFYDIDKQDLKEKYDLIIIDGPNGNGRNIAYLHIQDHIKSSSAIFIDDYNSHDNNYDYKFIDNLKNILNVEELYTHTNLPLNNKTCWTDGGNFAIYKVI